MLLLAGSLSLGVSTALAGLALADSILAWLARQEKRIEDRLRSLRLPSQHVHRHLMTAMGLVLAAFMGMSLWTGSLLLGALAAAAVALTPFWLLRRYARRRTARIEDQLADAMATMASAVRAGLSLSQGLELLADQCPRPLRDEFQQMVGEYRLGKPLEKTLLEAKQHLASETFSLLVAALLASRESGGKLNETIERIAHSVREIQRLERKVLSETAQARRSAVFMALAPLLIGVAYFFVDPVNTVRLFTTVPGQMIVAFAGALDVIAYLWARWLLAPDI